MKRNAIVRIILYAILALVLTGILVTSILADSFVFSIGSGSNNGIEVEYESSVEAENGMTLEINWAAGNVVVKREEDVDRIIFRETADTEIKHPMTYSYVDDTLELNHSNVSISFGVNKPQNQKKNLVVVVPMDWKCEKLIINGAALDITLDDIKVEELEVDGAGMNIDFFGWVKSIEIDGAGCKADLTCTNSVQKIQMDGAGCDLTVTLPEESGFMVQMDGLACNYSTDIASYRENGNIVYGDQQCKIEVDGIGCHVGVYFGGMVPSAAYPVRCGDDFTASLLLETPAGEYAPGTIIRLKTDVLTDVDLELYVNGKFVCKQTEAFSSDGANYWEFYFTMPDEGAVIQFKTVDGIHR